ncbi:MFS transporter [Deinococcus aquaedulcis]|uniref:MFS transporter n=1 Tax=Deinococcus aquaedulcis TaxID=2840455 RepID=UPI001C83472A|nr:MFS transporter [Deinococcus aquaedulcis]
MTPRPARRERLPLRAEGLAPVGVAAAALACAEFVRSGLYGAYLTQVIDTQFGLPVTAAAGAWTAHFLTDTAMRGPAGALVGRVGLRPVALGGAALSALALSLMLLAPPSVWLFLLASAVHGAGFSVMWPVAMNLTADAAREGYQGRALALVANGILPLSGVGFLVFGALAGRGDLFALWLGLGLLLLSVALTLLLPLRRVLPPAPDTDPSEGRPARSVMGALLPLLPAAFMQTLSMTLLGPWLFRIAEDGLSLSYWSLVAMLGLGGAVAYGAMPLTGRFADRDQGRARAGVMIGYGLVSLAFAGFALTPAPWLLYVLAVVAGLGYAFLSPAWAALVARVLPVAQRPAAWGVLMTVENAGTALGPLLGGLALAKAGVPGPFVLGAVLAGLTSAGYVVFRRVFQEARG